MLEGEEMKTTVELAQEAGVIEGFDTVHPSIDRLVALVRADERAAPVQEPVGALILGGVIDTNYGLEYEEWDVEWNTKAVEALQEKLVTSNGVTLMLYTTPPAAPDLQAELDATNRQVEILSDALAESRREVAALKAVQEPVAWEDVLGAIARGWTHPENAQKPMDVQLAVAIAKEIQDMYTTPPAAQRQHLTDGSLCWCEPETSYTDPETGASVVVHKGPQ
jgi:hypothetical protein